jgi:SRSO17 transposase
MTARRPCPPAPGPLEDYATQFDPLLASVAQRRGLRDYLQGLLLPRDRNKTLTALADAEPVVGAQHRQVQRLQWFLSESTRDHEAVNQQRIELLCADAATAPHAQGVLVIDDTGDRKDGSATAHVAHPVSWVGRQDRQRHRGRDQPMGGCALLLAAACGAVHAGVAVGQGQE